MTHYWWLVKADISRPRIYAVIVVILLAFRVDWSVEVRASFGS